MPQTKAQQISAEADKYVQTIALWGLNDDQRTWDMWVSLHKLDDGFAKRVRKVVDHVYN